MPGRSLIRKLGWDWHALGKIGPYTFAPYKVAWGEVGNDMAAAVVHTTDSEHLGTRIVVPDHTVITVSFDNIQEAHFVAAQLNSAPARLVVRGYIVLHPSPHVLEQVGLRKFDERNALHKRLCAVSQQAHELAARVATNPADEAAKTELAQVEAQIDADAAALWGLTDAELGEIRKALDVLA